MKQSPLKTKLLILLLNFYMCCPAQENNRNDSSQNAIDKNEWFRPNSVKINAYGLLLNNYSICYERMIAKRLSCQIGYRYQPYNYFGESIFLKTLVGRGAIDPKYLNFKIQNYAATVDFRYYISKRKSRRGVFVGIYGRYANFDIDNVDYTFITDEGTVYNVPLVGNLNGFGGGISYGKKWIIKKRIVVEVSSGIHYLKLAGGLVSNKDLSDLSVQNRADLKSNIEDIFTLQSTKYINVSVTDKGVDGRILGPSLGLRSCLNIGFCF